MRLEYVALVLALVLSVLGVVFVMLGHRTAVRAEPAGQARAAAARGRAGLHRGAACPRLRHLGARKRFGAGLSRPAVVDDGVLVAGVARGSRPSAGGNASARCSTAALAFVAGLSVLVRPELALIGGLALVMMLIAARGWRRRALIVVAGGLLPVAYQIFRMGYYGLLFPGTALAKDAVGLQVGAGLGLPHQLRPALSVVGCPRCCWSVLAAGAAARARPAVVDPPRRLPGYGRLARMVQSPPAVVVFMLVSGLLQAVYWIRQGGDFMHGRVLLTPLFCLLAPVAVIPVLLPDGSRMARGAGYQLAGATSVLWLAVVGWSLWAANSPGMGADATRVTYTGIVDERRFYSQATGNRAPADRRGLSRLSADACGARRAQQHPGRRAAAAVGQLRPVGRGARDTAAARMPPGSAEGRRGPHTVFFTNLGHARHERRPRRPGDRPDRSRQSVGRAHRAARETAASATTRTCSPTGRSPRVRS